MSHDPDDIPTNEPFELIIGNTWKWKRSFSHYDAADSWVITYTLINADNKINITATADGSDHLVNVLPSTTAGYKSGEYHWQAYATKGADRYLADQGIIELIENFTAKTTHDPRSYVKKVLDAIEATILKTATKDQLSTSIDGVSLSRRTPEQLLQLRNQFKLEYANEIKAERIANGLGHSGKVLVRF